jgi:hypothetical protein
LDFYIEPLYSEAFASHRNTEAYHFQDAYNSMSLFAHLGLNIGEIFGPTSGVVPFETAKSLLKIVDATQVPDVLDAGTAQRPTPFGSMIRKLVEPFSTPVDPAKSLDYPHAYLEDQRHRLLVFLATFFAEHSRNPAVTLEVSG